MNYPGKNNLENFISFIWQKIPDELAAGKRRAIHFSRLLFVLLRDISTGDLTLRAMSLVYTTLLSIVPLLAVSFSVLKGFGVQHQIEPLLFEFLGPLGDKGEEIGTNIVNFVNNINVGVLGSLGLALLFYTVLSLISKIEASFNYIWRIHNIRNFMQRFSYYLSVLLIGPVLIFSGLGLTATMMNNSIVQNLSSMEPFGTLFYIAGILTPYLLTIVAFAFVYVFLPNTKVKFLPAFSGAIAAALMWKSAGYLFATFITTSTNYNAIYSSFAILILFMIWIYVTWLIFLIGAQIAYYIQEPTMVTRYRSSKNLGNAAKEKMAMAIIYWIAKHFYDNKPLWTQEALSAFLNAPQDMVGKILEQFHEHGLVAATNDDDPSFMPAKDLEHISLFDVLKAIRSNDKHLDISDSNFNYCPQIETMDSLLNDALTKTFKTLTLKQWINT